jgi:hypothetical protein
MRVARLASEPARSCCTTTVRSRTRIQSRDKQAVSFVPPKVCSQCQTEQTDDESDATEESGIIDLARREREVVIPIERPPAHHIEMLERAATITNSEPKDHGGYNSVCIVIPKGASPSISTSPRQNPQLPELSSTPLSSTSSSSCYVVSPPSKPLKSSLRIGSSKGKKARAGPTKRRVRGLWNEKGSSCPFSDLHDDILLSIMSHLRLDDLSISSMVCRRWKHVTSQESAWKHVDATDLIRKTHLFHLRESPDAAAEANSTALAERLQSHSPERLTIRSIEHYLTADTYLPSLQGLKELTLTGFADFTDTHVHVMLLSLAKTDLSANTNVNFEMKARGKKENVLRKLALDQCPLLTNASIRSIAYNCPHLEELSLRGNHQMDDIIPLKDMWKLQTKLPSKSSLKQPPTSMTSLFALQQVPVLVVPDCPSTPPPATASAGLASLFALPGNSPTRRRVISLIPATVKPRKLTRVDFSNTRITAQAVVNSLNRAPGVVELESIVMRGSGESWSDVQFKALSKTLSVSRLSTFDVGCANAYAGSTTVTDVGLEALFLTTAAATAAAITLPLQRLELAGHRSIQAAAIANILTAAIDVVELDLETCKGVGSLSNKTGTIALGRALLKHGSGGGMGGLRRLSLARCFSNEKDSSSFTTKEFANETKRGSVLLKALCKSPSSRTLEHIDMSGCWFVTASDEAMLRLYCKRLVTLRLGGTRSILARETNLAG